MAKTMTKDKTADKVLGNAYLTPEQILELREQYLLPSTQTYHTKPLSISRASMQYVFDHADKKHLDAFAGDRHEPDRIGSGDGAT